MGLRDFYDQLNTSYGSSALLLLDTNRKHKSPETMSAHPHAAPVKTKRLNCDRVHIGGNHYQYHVEVYPWSSIPYSHITGIWHQHVASPWYGLYRSLPSERLPQRLLPRGPERSRRSDTGRASLAARRLKELLWSYALKDQMSRFRERAFGS